MRLHPYLALVPDILDASIWCELAGVGETYIEALFHIEIIEDDE